MFSAPDFALPKASFKVQLAPQNPGLQTMVYRFGHCEVLPASREVSVCGKRRRLQPRAFDLLVYLIEHRHRVLAIHELLDAVWPDRDVQVGSLATAIARVRAVLAEGGQEAIETHHRIGYRFVATLACDAGWAR